MKMNFPRPIRPGDTLALVAPSFGATIEPYITRLASAIRRLEERGYRIKAYPSTYKSDGIGISTDPAAAAKDLTDAWLDPDVAAVLSVGGGELMCETMSHVDLDALAAAPPKWYMGYSDNTNFLFPMAIRGVPGIYGPCATGLGKVWEGTETDALALLEGTKTAFAGYPLYEAPEDGDARGAEDPVGPFRLTQKKVLRTFVPKDGALTETSEEVRLSGALLGGCLDVVILQIGTKADRTREFLRENGPVIWILEACDLNVFQIRRALWQLREAGWFDTAAGFLIGRPLAALGQVFGVLDEYRAATDILAPLGVPVVFGCDFGHVPPMLPFVMGAEAEAAVRGNALELIYKT
ncbi:MAG: LD-carboxypeptidase [Lachnospiraceae bacterium]|nr:LD-carboxypeptidase [Lachnospiraceae bacterium]